MTSRRFVFAAFVLFSSLSFAQEWPEDWNGDSDDEGPSVSMAPPSMTVETPSPQPFPGAVWTSGHWYWDGDEWRLKAGAWVAPMYGYHFINGYWARTMSGWSWVPGGWAPNGSQVVEFPMEVTAEAVATEIAPPQPRVEIQPMRPAPGYVWASGYWYWTGMNWTWIGGSWMAPPREDLVYVSPRWIPRGRTWVFTGGGWACRGSSYVTIPLYRHARFAYGFGRRDGHRSWGNPYFHRTSWNVRPAYRSPPRPVSRPVVQPEVRSDWRDNDRRHDNDHRRGGHREGHGFGNDSRPPPPPGHGHQASPGSGDSNPNGNGNGRSRGRHH